MDLEREEGEECEENMEVFDDSSSSPSGTLRNYPLTCKVLYSYKVQTSRTHRAHICSITARKIKQNHISTLRYSFIIPFLLCLIFNAVGVSLLQASQPDELTIDEQEMLEVIEDGDMEDWVKVHKY